jgi:predicted ATPase
MKVVMVDSDGKKGITDNISDVGFGLSQVIPMLVQAAVMNPGNTLIIEQPELHLHPKAQNALAKVVADAARNGRRFIIETHSEHFIRGLQVAISENTIDSNHGIPCNYLNTIYIHNTPIDIIPLKNDNTGEYTKPWPSGFFDESYNIAYQLLKNKAIISSLVEE